MIKLKEYKIAIQNDGFFCYAKRNIAEQLVNDICDTSINAFRFDIKHDCYKNEKILICETYNILENERVVVSFKTETPPASIWAISESIKPKFMDRFKLALKFLFKKDKGYFEEYCYEHKKEIENLEKKINEEKSNGE